MTGKLKKIRPPKPPVPAYPLAGRQAGGGVPPDPRRHGAQDYGRGGRPRGAGGLPCCPASTPRDLLAGITGAAAVWLVVYFKRKNAKKYRKNVEYGSARWGTPKDIAPFVDPKPEKQYHTDRHGKPHHEQPPQESGHGPE